MQSMVTATSPSDFRNLVNLCREEVRKQFSSEKGEHRFRAEIKIQNGEEFKFSTKAKDRDTAIEEVLTFIDAIERTTGYSCGWKIANEGPYYFGTNYDGPKSTTFSEKVNFWVEKLLGLA